MAHAMFVMEEEKEMTIQQEQFDVQTSKQVFEDWQKKIDYYKEHPEEYHGYRTGIADLDDLLVGGIWPGWFVIISAQKKTGKTSILTTMRQSFLEQGLRVGSVSLEESPYQLAERHVSSLASIDRGRFRDLQSLNEDDWQDIRGASNEGANWSGGFWSDNIVNFDQLEDFVFNYDLDILIADYFQLFDGDPAIKTRSEQLAKMSRAAKKLTRKVNPHTGKCVALLFAAQLNDDDNYLDSRSIGRDGDVVTKVRKVKDNNDRVIDNRLDFEVSDSRHSGTPTFQLFFNGAQSKVGSIAGPELVNLNEVVNKHLNQSYRG